MKSIIIIPIILLFALGVYSLAYLKDKPPQSENSAHANHGQIPPQTEQSNNGSAIETVIPKKETKEIALLGEVLSNKTANIYPRRDGIVRDIYVDIGDQVRAGQTLALLLPPGVEDESSSEIAERQTMLQSAKNTLNATQKLALAEIAKAEQNIKKSKTALDATQKDVLAKIEAFQKMIESMEAEIQTSQAVMESIQQNEQSQLRKNEILTHTAAEESITLFWDTSAKLLSMLLPTNIGKRSVYYSDFDNTPIGALASLSKTGFINAYNGLSGNLERVSDLNQEEKLLLITNKLFQTILETLSQARSMIIGTPMGTLTAKQIEEYLSSIDGMREKIISSRGELTELIQEKEVIAAEFQKEKADIKKDIVVGAANLTKLKKELESLEAASDKELAMVLQELKLIMAEKEQILRDQNMKVTEAQNTESLAKSALNTAAASKGHNVIVSPFSGIVTERYMRVGESVNPSQPVLRLDQVDTYLAKKNPVEIKFGVPEQYKSLIKLGDIVSYFLIDQEDTRYEGAIARLGTDIDPTTRNLNARILADKNASLPNGASVRILIPLDEHDGYSAPQSSLRKDETGDYVWIISENKNKEKILLKKYIHAAFKEGETAYIRGVSEEDFIVKEPLAGWVDGMPLMSFQRKLESHR